MLIELHFLPCLEYMALVGKAETVWIETAETFQRQTYRNRCYIKAAHHTERLSVPIKAETKRKPITTVTVDYREKWHILQWRSIVSAYRKAPYFEYYSPYLEPIWFSETPFLFELNWQLFQTILKLLGWDKKIQFTEQYEKNTSVPDYRNQLTDHTQLRTIHEPYFQLFGEKFEPNLSILDLLFSEGKGASAYLDRLGKRIITESLSAR